MKLKVRRGYEFEVKQKVQGYIVQEGLQYSEGFVQVIQRVEQYITYGWEPDYN